MGSPIKEPHGFATTTDTSISSSTTSQLDLPSQVVESFVTPIGKAKPALISTDGAHLQTFVHLGNRCPLLNLALTAEQLFASPSSAETVRGIPLKHPPDDVTACASKSAIVVLWFTHSILMRTTRTNQGCPLCAYCRSCNPGGKMRERSLLRIAVRASS